MYIIQLDYFETLSKKVRLRLELTKDLSSKGFDALVNKVNFGAMLQRIDILTSKIIPRCKETATYFETNILPLLQKAGEFALMGE